jgi:hypothetical protein
MASLPAHIAGLAALDADPPLLVATLPDAGKLAFVEASSGSLVGYLGTLGRDGVDGADGLGGVGVVPTSGIPGEVARLALFDSLDDPQTVEQVGSALLSAKWNLKVHSLTQTDLERASTDQPPPSATPAPTRWRVYFPQAES